MTDRVVMIGRFNAAYRPAYMAQAMLQRPDAYALTLRDPAWDTTRYGWILGRLIYFCWAFLHILSADLVLFTAMSHGARPYRVLMRWARLLKRRVIIDFYISLYESRVTERRGYAEDSAKARGFMAADRLALSLGRPVLVLSQAELRHYCAVADLNESQITYAKVPLVIPDKPQAQIPILGRDSTTTTLVWWGYLGNPLHGLDVIRAAHDILSARHGERIRLLLFPAGSPNKLEAFRREWQDAQGVEIDIEATMSNGRLTERLCHEADIALGAFGGTLKARTVPINKIIEAMAMGLPSITGHSAAFAEELEDGTLPMVPHNDPAALADAVDDLLANKDRLRQLAALAHDAWKRCYSPQAFDDRFIAALR